MSNLSTFHEVIIYSSKIMERGDKNTLLHMADNVGACQMHGGITKIADMLIQRAGGF